MNAAQNEQVELLSKLALSGGAYAWNSAPIGDAESVAEDPVFRIERPLEAFRRASLEAATRRDNLLLVEGARAPHLGASSWRAAAPANPFDGRRGTPRESEQTDHKIVQMLDRIAKKMDKAKRQRADEAEARRRERRENGEHEERGSSQVQGDAHDRAAAFDVAAQFLPLGQEVLKSWQGWLYQFTDQFNPKVRAELDNLQAFLARVKGRTKYDELSRRDKRELEQIVVRLAEAEA
jgi:hypothetical protein